MRKMSIRSFTGFYLIDLAPHAYRGIYDGLITKYFPGEPFNKQAMNLKDSIDRDLSKEKE